MLFTSRKEAGEQLAGRLTAFADRVDVVILSLVPGGVPVGFEISSNLNLCFDIFPIFKFYSPYNKYFAFGATSLNNTAYIDKDLLKRLDIHESFVASLKAESIIELEKLNHLYRNGKAPIDLEDKIVIIVDDGACSEDDIYFASKLISKQFPKSIIIASPVLSSHSCSKFDESIENIVCLAETPDQININHCYQDFSKVSDSEVNLLFERTSNKQIN